MGFSKRARRRSSYVHSTNQLEAKHRRRCLLRPKSVRLSTDLAEAASPLVTHLEKNKSDGVE
jgi:hypothetical protein